MFLIGLFNTAQCNNKTEKLSGRDNLCNWKIEKTTWKQDGNIPGKFN